MTIQSEFNTNKKENAIAYLRVSTNKQKEEGNSINAQKRYATNYAKEHRFNIIEFVEESESASRVNFNDSDFESSVYSGLKNRPKLLNILLSSNKNKFTHLLVSSRDRLARNLELYVGIRYFLQRNNIKIHFCAPGELVTSNNTALENLTELVIASIAELEANLISVRVRDGMSERVKDNLWPGGIPPYGYIKDENKMIQPAADEPLNIKKIFKLYNNYGYSYRKIAEIMNSDHNISHWTKNKIERIIKNELYCGHIIWGRSSRRKLTNEDDRRIQSTYIENLAIIEKDSWQHSLKLRHKKSKLKDPKYYSTPFLLRDKLICNKCGNYLEGKNYGKDKYGKQREGVYRCPCRNNYSNRDDKMVFKQSLVENKFSNEFFANINPKGINTLWAYYTITKNRITKSNEKNLQIIQAALDKNHSILSNLQEKISFVNNKELKETFAAQKPYYENEKLVLETYEQELKAIPSLYSTNQSHLEDRVKRFFKEDFYNLTTERKRIIVDMLIDKIIISKTNNNIELKIYMNASLDTL